MSHLGNRKRAASNYPVMYILSKFIISILFVDIMNLDFSRKDLNGLNLPPAPPVS